MGGLRVALREHRRALLVSPTGSGKTVMFSYMAQSAASKGLRVEILAHREELIDQISGTLARFGVRHGFVAADAARMLASQSYIVMTWPGGSKAVAKADWAPLAARKVLIWPGAIRRRGLF